MSVIYKTGEKFNYSLYNSLLPSDQDIVDEYISKMTVGEINSFMQRFVEYYPLESEKEILEVNEDIDSVLVFEKSSSSRAETFDFRCMKCFTCYTQESNRLTVCSLCNNKFNIKNNKTTNSIIKHKINIPYNRIIDCLNKYFIDIKPQSSMWFFSVAVKKFFEQECHKISENYISWSPDLNIQDSIRALYIELLENKNTLRELNNIRLPLHFYTYRVNGIVDVKKRMGIVIDKAALPATLRSSAGYGPNFKMDKKFISVIIDQEFAQIDISDFIRSTGHWSPKNAILHGFDDKAGIIWFNGTRIAENIWQLPNGSLISNGNIAKISAIITTDAFSKMYQRFNINAKLRSIVSDLEIETHI